MRYSLWRSSVLILVSLVFLAVVGCRAEKGPWTASQAWHDPVKPEGEDWNYDGLEGLVLETDHFRIHTTVSDAQLLEKLPQFLETAYQRYEAYLPSAEVQEQPLEVYLFGRRYEWEKYTRENMGPMAEKYLKIRAGAYSHKGVCVAYLLDPYHTFGVLAHEGFHQFSNYRLKHRIPAWMEEGLACNFEAHFWRGGSADFAPDLNEFRISALKRALRGGTLFELSELLSMDAGDAVSLPAERTATYYAQVWALTRFLQEGQKGEYRPGFKRLLDDAADGANLYSRKRAVDVFQSYFKQDIEIVAGQLVDYAKLLTRRLISPGMEIVVISADQRVKTVEVTKEQIEQSKALPPEEPAAGKQEPEGSQDPQRLDQPPPVPVLPELEPIEPVLPQIEPTEQAQPEADDETESNGPEDESSEPAESGTGP